MTVWTHFLRWPWQNCWAEWWKDVKHDIYVRYLCTIHGWSWQQTRWRDIWINLSQGLVTNRPDLHRFHRCEKTGYFGYFLYGFTVGHSDSFGTRNSWNFQAARSTVLDLELMLERERREAVERSGGFWRKLRSQEVIFHVLSSFFFLVVVLSFFSCCLA